ncbi:MAG TPA: phosphotransferase [Thermoanaerobaculia bacterium]|nr:phosphotransferase [Thermoanaerobaculia bacterium]
MEPLAAPRSLPAALELLRGRGHGVAAARAMAGDVSRRCYFRLGLAGGGTAILALYPADLEETCRRFLASGELLAGAGIRVPAVIDRDCAAGWALIEDLGERTLYEHGGRPWSELAGYFEDAVGILGRLRTLPAAAVAALNPPLDRELLARELRQTRELFLEPLGLAGSGEPGGDLARRLEAALETVCDRLGAEPPVPCHRDFGARNLVPLATAAAARVGVLDHQDLRLGPPAYDLASLLNDSLFPPPELEERLLQSAGPDRESYHRAAGQRTLKAIGSYAAFARRGSPRHLPLIPPTLARALEHLRRLPEASALVPRLAELWRPVLAGTGLDRVLP